MSGFDLAARLELLAARDALRVCRVREGQQGPTLWRNAEPLADFCSNDYLGLASHPEVIDALTEGARRYGVGSGAAHLVSGHCDVHEALEEELAQFTGHEAALLFSSGYMANMGAISALMSEGGRLFQDRLNHASLLDGGRLSAVRQQRYPHLDVDALESLLARSDDAPRLIVTDGVFSMDGDIAPLPALVAAAARHHAWLMVDDAHGLGVLGAAGAGTLQHFGLAPSSVQVQVGTLGKALGTSGAFVAGSRELIRYLMQKARTFMFTTAMPPAIAMATRASLRLAAIEQWRRDALSQHIALFRAEAENLGLTLLPSYTPIQGIVLGDNQRALSASDALARKGYWVVAIRPPTVPEGTARLRITLSAAHAPEQITGLVHALAECLAGNAP
ncbi:MAG: 8-amino-7-oxononanoate synthase [Pseudomonadota bacterium]